MVSRRYHHFRFAPIFHKYSIEYLSFGSVFILFICGLEVLLLLYSVLDTSKYLFYLSGVSVLWAKDRVATVNTLNGPKQNVTIIKARPLPRARGPAELRRPSLCRARGWSPRPPPRASPAAPPAAAACPATAEQPPRPRAEFVQLYPRSREQRQVAWG